MQVELDYSVFPFPRYGYGRAAHGLLYEIFEARRSRFADYIRAFMSFQGDFGAVSTSKSPEAPTDPFWNNGFFPGLDAVSLYCLMCIHQPSTFCEIGSGYSTNFAGYAIRQRRLKTQLVSIDPDPRTEVDSICDLVLRNRVEDIPPDYFAHLADGDFLFVDGSHRCFMNSDVAVFFLDILPRLRSGVFVQLHDIFLPYDYPEQWSDRFYNEQYLLACVLLSQRDLYDIHLANTFITFDPDLRSLVARLFDHPSLVATQSSWEPQSGWSFWMRKL